MYISSENQSALQSSYAQLSSGKRINSAADDASGFAISEKLGAQVTGLEVGTKNALDMQGLLNTAEGGLSNINDSLLRIRELAVYAQNGILTDSDKKLLQYEADQLLEGIKNAAQYTQFNRINVLDGNFVDKNLASNPNGTGMKINIENATLPALGLDNLDITKLGGDAIKAIDNALDMVNDARAKIGAQSNAIDYVVSANETSYLNMMQAKSRIEDADMAKAVMDMNIAKVLEQVQMFSIKNQMENMRQKNMFLL